MCIHLGLKGWFLKEREKEKEIRNAGQTAHTQKLEVPSMCKEAGEGKEGRLCIADGPRSSFSGNCHILLCDLEKLCFIFVKHRT